MAEAQTGKEIKPSVQVIPLTAEAADGYTVKYYVDGVAVAEGTAVAMDVSATSDKTFTISYTPTDEVTTEHETYIEFEFTDGTKIASEHQTLKVTNEPKFLFVAASTSVSQYTTNLTTAQAFGKVNVATESKSFKIYNQGTAPLNVTSIVAPEGFSVNKTEAVVAAGESEDIVVTFSAATPGEYAGNLVVSYTQDGAQTYELAFSGTMLDQTKWYANFDNASTSEIVWPAGSVYESSVNTSYSGWGPYNYYIYSRSSSNNKFTTPKLTAAAGDVFHFDARAYSSYYSNGTIKVYASATRTELGDAIAELSVTDYSNWATQDVTITTAGDYFITLEFENVQIDELYGLSLTPVEHDWTIASSNIPTEAMQNVASTATVNILNLGLADEAADSYTVTAFVNGEAAGTGTAVALPMSHKLSDAGTQLSVSYLSTKKGTFPVYLEVKAGAYSVTTDPVDVVFAEEVASGDVATGTSAGTDSTTPLNLYYKNSETIALYTQANLGLSGGEKINSITWKGYTTSSHTSTLKVYYQWTDATTIAAPSSTGNYDVTGMTAAIEPTSKTWTVGGSADNLQDQIVVNFTTPITYENGKSLLILVSSSASGYASSSAIQFEKSTTTGYAYQHQNDGTEGVFASSWSAKNLPLIHIGVEVEDITLAGTVKTSGREAIANATVTLKAANGVEYSCTTDAEGNYSFNVIQADLDFTATVEAENYLKKEFAYSLGGESKTLNVTLYKSFGVVGTFPGFDWDNDKVMTQSTEDPNIFTLVVPDVELTAGTTYKFKVRADGIWKADSNDGYELPNSGDESWTINTTGIYTLKFTADVSNHTLAFELPFTLSETADGIADLNWVTIDVEREFKAGWNAVVLPFALSAEEVASAFGANAEVAYYAGDEANAAGNVTVKFNKRSGIDAGAPCLLWLENAVSGLKFTKNISSTLWPTEGTTFDFVGVYTTTGVNAGDYFIKGGEFVKATTNNTVKPFRSYLKLKDGQSAARSLNFVFDDQTTTELIEGLEIEGQTIVEGVYNLNGQKVQNMNRKGLYIINGKKVMVK